MYSFLKFFHLEPAILMENLILRKLKREYLKKFQE